MHINLRKAQQDRMAVYLMQLTETGGLFSRLGLQKECERCYSLYISMVESLEGGSTIKVA